MIRDLIRDETSNQRPTSLLSRFFDNVYVLIILLIIVLWFGWYLHTRNQIDPADQLAEARAVFLRPAGPGWLRSRDQILLESHVLSDDEQEIRQLISLADQYDFARTLRTEAIAAETETAEVRRQIRRAFEIHESGDPISAISHAKSVLLMMGESDEYRYLKVFLTETIGRWGQQPNIAGRRLLLADVLHRCNSLVSNDPASPEATELLTAAVQVYAGDPAVEDLTELCMRVNESRKPVVVPDPALGVHPEGNPDSAGVQQEPSPAADR